MRRSTHSLVVFMTVSYWLPACAVPLSADEGEEFFESKIRPVLVDYCYECHSMESDDADGGLMLDTRDGIRRGGETGPAVVPNDLDESLLISAIEYRDLEMPPDEKLDDDVIRDFKKWIRMGAPDPRDGKSEMPGKDDGEDDGEDDKEDEQLWSLKPVVPAEVPNLENHSWARSGVDSFISAAHAEQGLSPVAEASSESLVRRVFFDLTGLPPSADEVNAFVSDSSDAAFERMVDQLIASSQFGERWGRHWLDVARYGESAGSSRDVLMLYSWRYRDYVIDAFNSDLPYNEFVRQQIAGDLLPYESDEQRRRQTVATGLLAIGSKSLNGGNLTLDIADDQIDVVGKAFMGLTVSCARCHDHKFDPIPTADYYALAGIFRNTKTFYGGSTNRPKNIQDQLKVYLPLNENAADAAEQMQEIEKERASIRKDLTAAKKKEANLKRGLPKNWQDLVAAADSERATDEDKAALSKQNRAKIEQYQKVAAQVADLNAKDDQLSDRLSQLPTLDYAFAAQDMGKPRNWPIQVRGDKGKNGDVVPRGFLTCVSVATVPAVKDDASGRQELAEWLTQPDHPLTARVMVNRVWQHLFGTGLVASVNNFGTTGEKPSHPELLDWLANRFVHHHNWSVKSLIRELVLTQTYRASNEYNARNWEKDPTNRFLWRMSRRRLEAEAIRDAMLVASGNLNVNRPEGSLVQKIGEGEVGRNINTKPLAEPFPHRSVYMPIIRGLLPEMLKVFDFPEPGNPAGQRSTTNVPLQSLFLMNNEFVQEQAMGIANRAMQSSSDQAERIESIWLMCLSRRPTESELVEAGKFLDGLRASRNGDGEEQPLKTDDELVYDSDVPMEWQVLCQSVLASAEFRFIE